MVRITRRVTGIAVTAPGIERDERLRVLERYSLGHGQSRDEARDDEPQILVEARVRYRDWTKSPYSSNLLRKEELQRLDELGPLPRALLADEDFMRFVLRSRDLRSGRDRRFRLLSLLFFLLGVASLVVSFLESKMASVHLILLIAGPTISAASAAAFTILDRGSPAPGALGRLGATWRK
jgi:hypothetical protein